MVSDHYPLLCLIHGDFGTKHLVNKVKTQLKVNWDKIDKAQYQADVECHMPQTSHTLQGDDNRPDRDLKSELSILCETLTYAAKSQIPSTKRSDNTRPKRMSNVVSAARKQSKHSFWQWKCAGRPMDVDNTLYVNMKFYKQELRRVCRTEQATSRYTYKNTDP